MITAAQELGRSIAQVQAVQDLTGANLQRAIIPLLEKYLLDARISALEEAADAAISDGLFHTHDAEGRCICGNCSARRAILSLATKLKEGTI
jgi:hypothetical protein